MTNIKLTIAYDGTGYFGWQRQSNQITIQEVLENKLSLICGGKTTLYGAGRTDARVHALEQAANFKTHRRLDEATWRRALNSMLPKDILIKKVEFVEKDFHARYAAQKKRYCYRLLLAPYHCPFERNYAWQLHYLLDLEAMREASAYLLGEHDFASFQGVGGSVKTSIRSLEKLSFNLEGKLLRIDVAGNGFLRHMVRNIVGTLVEIGRGKLSPEDLPKILAARDRAQAGPTAPPQGLYLVKVEY